MLHLPSCLIVGRKTSHPTVIRTITEWASERGAERELCEKKWKIKAEAVEERA